MTFPRVYWSCAFVVAATLAILNADREGFGSRDGSTIDAGSAFANGLLAFAIVILAALLGYFGARRSSR